MNRPNRPVLLLGAIILTVLTAAISGCGVFDADRPSAEVMEAEIARCLDIDPNDVDFNWNEDGAAFTVGTSGGEIIDQVQYTRCINEVLDGY